MSMLENDLVPHLSASETSVALFEVVERRAVEEEAGVERGRLALRPLELLRGEEPAVGEEIEVAYERMRDENLRVRNLANQWNLLSLAPDTLLLLAVRANGAAAPWSVLAGVETSSRSAREVEAVREALRIEEVEDTQLRIGRYAAALQSQPSLLRRFALDALTRRRVAERQVAAELVASALDAAPTDPDSSEELADALASEYLFDEDLGVEPTNTLVVSHLATHAIEAGDAEERDGRLDELAGVVFSEFADDESKDDELRRALVRSVMVPTSDEVIRVLEQHIAAVDEEDAEVAADLLELWQNARPSS